MKNDDIKRSIECLRKLESEYEKLGFETYVEAIALKESNFELKLNSYAAVELARMLIDLISANIDGKHQHLDELNFVDSGNGKLTLIFIKND